MKRRFNRGDGVVQNQPMDMRKKEKHEQAVSWWQVRMLIIVAAILFLLVSLSFNVGRNESSHIASTQTHVSTKANFHPPIENNPNSRGTSNNKQLDAVIHVGLFKTGTTTIQGALGWSLYEDLLKDNYYFLGRTGGQNFMNVTEKGIVTGRDTFIQFSGKNTRCLFPNPGEVERWGECNLNQTKVKTFVGILRQHYEDGHHVSVSWEGLSLLSDERIEFLGSVFRAAGYEPRIVVSSRYYHEWVPSWIQQYFRPAKYNKQLDKFEDAGGARIPTLPQFLADPLFYHRYCYFGFDDCHYDWLSTSNAPAASLRNRFQRFFPSVQLFQYSQEGDLVTNFICQALQFADKTCHGLQDGTLTSPERDLQKSLLLITMDYQYLAQAAYDKYNLVHFSEKRQVFAKRIRRHHERLISQQCKGKCSNETELPFDRLCLSKNEKELFANRTISYELEVFPSDFVQSDGGKKYEELLWNMILDRMEDDKYCALDVNTTLVKPEWELFFRGLEPRTKKKTLKVHHNGKYFSNL